MRPEVAWAIGVALTLAGWTATRIVARSRGSSVAALALDGAFPVLGFAVLAAIGARPVFAGVAMFALTGGLAFADYAKRAVLREPVLFCDMSELVELFRHPQLYLPYAGPVRIVGCALAAVLAVGLLIWLEPAAFAWSPFVAAGAALFAAAVVLGPATVLLAPAGRAMARFAPLGDPVADSARLGTMASLFIYGVIARSERPARRAAVRPQASAHLPPGAPVVVVQSESFFDVRRLGGGLFGALLDNFHRLSVQGRSGQFSTPAWGANTVRTEFAAITGLSGADLGFDRFNPYHAFVRQPVASLAWTMKARGYRTICLHPYDRRFYGRDRVMAHLGFDEFVGQEGFAAPAAGRYISDADLTKAIVERLDAHGTGLFIFAITMENHGPWHGRGERAFDPAPSLPPVAQAEDLKQFAATLAGADAMARDLAAALSPGGVLAFYGDHLPSLPKAFAALGFAGEATDYFVWREGGSPMARADIAAHDLPAAIMAALDEGRADLP